ncbi:hypothetical protein DPMN_034359 [Dreissena polymorpha]|uniref:Uncharacterized protein n=1 Tax=Dreissena polymorpha TaxID=45954 RepID=A0A9D4M7H2_DREPO|nr:hypothetical protein DPMN_034359 [Dreissena polymorpha]
MSQHVNTISTSADRKHSTQVPHRVTACERNIHTCRQETQYTDTSRMSQHVNTISTPADRKHRTHFW